MVDRIQERVEKIYTISKTIPCAWFSDTKQARAATSVNEYNKPEPMTADNTGRSGPLVERMHAARRSTLQIRYANKRVVNKFVESVVA